MDEDVFAPAQAQVFYPHVDDVIQSDMESQSAPTSAKLVKAGHAHHFTRRMHPWALAQQIASRHILAPNVEFRTMPSIMCATWTRTLCDVILMFWLLFRRGNRLVDHATLQVYDYEIHIANAEASQAF